MALSIQYWVKYTAGQPKLSKKSEQAVEAGRILRFVYDVDTMTANAVVQASMRDKSYKTVLYLSDDFTVDSTCECPLGKYKCHHVAAVLLYGYKHVTKTDVKCAWLKKPKLAPKHIQTVEDIYPHKAAYSAHGRPVTAADKLVLYDGLSSLNRFTALHWIMTPEPAPVPNQLIVPIVSDVLTSDNYKSSINRQIHLMEKLAVDEGTIQMVARQTIGQHLNPLWCLARRCRLTASNFGAMLKAINSGRYTNSLKTLLLSEKSLDAVRSIAWGRNHEAEAINKYRSYGGVVEETGLWLHPSGVLGASPDGFITRPALMETRYGMLPDSIEVKCPYSAKDMTIMEAVASLKDFYLTHTESGLLLKKSHNYYHQVQGTLHITNKTCCDFVVWTLKDCAVITIPKDPAWGPNLDRLLQFYHTKFMEWLEEML